MHVVTVRRLPVVALLAALLLPFLAVRPAAAAVDAKAEARFVQLINAARVEAGAEPLVVRTDLVAVARRHSARMAAQVKLHHNPRLGEDVANWQKVGENVGRGPRVDPIHTAFMQSAGHRRNLLDPAFTEVGVGVEVRDGRVWVTEIFRKPMSAQKKSTATSPAPATTADDAVAAPARPTAPRPTIAPIDRDSVLAGRLGSARERAAFTRFLHQLAR